MAMKGLVEGDCGGSNPLLRLASHYTQDRGFTNEGLQGGFHATTSGAASDLSEAGLVREFLAETRTVTARPPQTFRMDSLLREMRDMESLGAVPRQAPPVASLASPDDTWATELLETEQNVIDWSRDFLAEHTASLGGPDPVLTRSSGGHHHTEVIPGLEDKWAEQYLDDVPSLLTESDAEAEQSLAEARQRTEAAPPPHLDPQEFQDFIASVGKDSAVTAPAVASVNLQDDAAWAEEFVASQQFTQSDVSHHPGQGGEERSDTYKQDFWRKLEEEWKEIAQQDETHPWLADFNSNSYDPFKEYKFSEDNPVREHSSPLEEGKRMLAMGDLPSAVLYFEAAVQRQPGSVEAWQLLGKSQAENEQDPAAISALRKCLSLDPRNGAAWMALSVCFTNESYQAQACHALAMWIQSHPDYSALLPPAQHSPTPDNFRFTSSFMSSELHEETVDLFLRAARARATTAGSATLDPDVQAGLGVLFNLSGDFDKAVDCFRAAIAARPEDSLLWNRLGATLANSNRSEEAVSAYHTALTNSPGFVRCRYNLGVSCINLKAYKEAVEHFLTALNFQDSGRGPGEDRQMSESIWSSLRLAVNLMQRRDLAPLLDSRDLQGLSSQFGVTKVTNID